MVRKFPLLKSQYQNRGLWVLRMCTVLCLHPSSKFYSYLKWSSVALRIFVFLHFTFAWFFLFQMLQQALYRFCILPFSERDCCSLPTNMTIYTLKTFCSKLISFFTPPLSCSCFLDGKKQLQKEFCFRLWKFCMLSLVKKDPSCHLDCKTHWNWERFILLNLHC